MTKFIQLTRMHFGPDSTKPKDLRIWIAVAHIEAIQPSERKHLMHGVERTFTYVYALGDNDTAYSVTESPEEILRAIDAQEGSHVGPNL
jgi:hypothetical protein